MREVVSPELARYRKYADEINARRRKKYATSWFYRTQEQRRDSNRYLMKKWMKSLLALIEIGR